MTKLAKKNPIIANIIKLYNQSQLHTILVLSLIIFAFAFRVFRLSIPTNYIFDEVYHVPTLRAYSQNNPAGYEWWQTAPEPNTAYDWLHPPLAKLIQAVSVKILGDHSFAWRFPSAVFGTLSILALYFFTLTLFKNKQLALLAAFIFSLDGLQLTMSRIAMNDIFVTTWTIFSLAFFFKYINSKSKQSNKFLFLTGLFTGLALATKWSALFLYPIFLIFLLPKIIKSKKLIKNLLFTTYYLLFIPLIIYLLSYSQFFLQGHTLEQFRQLNQQIINYQTTLKATHDYQSTAAQWPLLLKPVWFHVDYNKTSTAHIYNLGNPIIFWSALIAVFYSIAKLFSKAFNSSQPLPYSVISYFFLWAPWILSPRILFFHHYLPALPFICLILAWSLWQLKPPFKKPIISSFLLLTFAVFIFFYPLNTAVPIPARLLKYWFWLPTWK